MTGISTSGANAMLGLRCRSMLAGGITALARPALGQNSRASTLRFVPSANLSFTDPSISAAGVTINHGYAVFDTLYGVDAHSQPKPQMVERHDVSDNQRIWTFRLRDGLKFHDGTPVRGADCIASIRRWGASESFGQALIGFTDRVDAPDDGSFRILLKRPMGVVIEALAHSAPIPLFILPGRLASTDPFKPVTEIISSGPYRFVADAFVPASHMAYQRNDAYVPRDEAPEWTSGGKHCHFQRLEWSVVPDPATAAAAMQNGEVDWCEGILLDLVSQLQKSANVAVRNTSPFGLGSVARFNFANPPFNNPALRRIVRDAVGQVEYMRAIHGDDDQGYSTCYASFLCVLPGVTEFRTATTGQPNDFASLRAAVKAAGYGGEKVTVINPTDYSFMSSQGVITADLLRKLGFDVDVEEVDFGTSIQRRVSKAPAGKGGWSVFHTSAAALSLANPAVNYFTRGPAEAGWAGWYASPQAESLVTAWMTAPDDTSRQAAFDAAQRLAWDDVSIVPLGFWRPKTAYRKDIVGTVQCDYALFWNARRA